MPSQLLIDIVITALENFVIKYYGEVINKQFFLNSSFDQVIAGVVYKQFQHQIKKLGEGDSHIYNTSVNYNQHDNEHFKCTHTCVYKKSEQTDPY